MEDNSENLGTVGGQTVPVYVHNEQPNYSHTFNKLSQQMTNVTTVLASQCVKNSVQTFDGQPKHFREWTHAIE